MKKIKLTKGKYALVDKEDFDQLNKWKWTAAFNGCTKSYYAHRTIVVRPRSHSLGRANTTIIMSRQIMNYPKNMDVDHINHNTLDNRRTNLRMATRSQNKQNERLRKDNRLGIKGVCSRGNKYIAQIQFNKKKIYLGLYENREQAKKAYRKASEYYFGEFSNQ